MRNPILPTTLAAGTLLLVSAFGAYGQLQSGTQQACLNGLNKDGAAVARTQGKESVGCLKSAEKGTIPPGTAQACLVADAKGKVQKAKSKTTADETKSCGTAPSFGYTSAAIINGAAAQAEVDLTADVFGANLDAAVFSCVADKPRCTCQQKVQKTVEQLAAVKLAAFVSCKKAALKAGASSAAALSACVNNSGTAGSIAADTKGKIAKTLASLNTGITKSCDTPGVTAGAFPGSCTALSGAALGACLDTRVECRVCQAINEMDGLFINCDVFDDGVANTSCASGTGPTPTPTATLTPTPTLTPPPTLTSTPGLTSTPTPTLTPPPTLTPTPGPTSTFVPGTIFQGNLEPTTTGRFNYNLVLGLPGSDAACNTAFPGSHTCTYAELQAADAANDLLAHPNATFWAIDSAQPNTRQCKVTIAWDYATAHTGQFGDKVVLTTGHLGALQPTQICAVAASVGCCQ